jgi:hypothetical protein
MKNDSKYNIKRIVNAFRCLRCGHEWIPRVELSQLEGKLKEKPRLCPKCKSAYWDLERKRKNDK